MIRIALVICLTLSGCGEEPAPREPTLRVVRYVVAGESAGALRSTFLGVCESSEQSRLSFRSTGAVRSVDVDVGDAVEMGQVLARLDTSDLTLAAAEASSGAQQARAEVQRAQAEYQRVRSLYEARGASRGELDAARADAASARTALSAAQSRVARARNDVQYGTLVAPAAGRISEVAIEAGENVTAGSTALVLQSGDGLQARVAVPSSQVARIEQGARAIVTFPALAVSQPGAVTEIGVAADGASYPITIRLDEKPEGARPGMAVEARFEITEEEDVAVLIVPSSAVAGDSEGEFVYVIEDLADGVGTLRRRTVSLGEVGDDGIEVAEGLAAGELVLTAGVSRASDAQRVRAPSLTVSPTEEP